MAVEGSVQSSKTSIFRVVIGCIVGAIVSAGLGFGLSACLSMRGLALILPAEGVNASSAIRMGLNFLAIHHIRLAGSSSMAGDGSLHVSILWPITIWAVVPAIALMAGGFISGKIARSGKFYAGAGIAVPYAAILLIARPHLALSTASIALPRLDIGGWDTAPNLLAAQLSPALGATLFYGLIFGVIFGSIGALGGPVGFVKGLFRRDSSWPAAMRGALTAVILGQLVFLLILTAFGVSKLSHQPKGDDQSSKLPTKTAVTLLPAVVGLSNYLAHGVTICCDAGSTAAPEQGIRFRAGIVNGISNKDTIKPVKPWAYSLLLISGLALLIGGCVAARTMRAQASKAMLIAGFAGSYALLMTALTPLFSLVQRTEIATELVKNSASIIVRPSAAQTFMFSLLLALVFGSLGVITRRNNANS